MRSYNPVVKGHQGQIKKAVQLLLDAERPMVYTGGGVILADASELLNRLVDKLGFPCTNTLMGLGAYKASDPKFMGMPGMHGTYEANMAMQHCDVLLAVGTRFDDRVIGNPKHFATQPAQDHPHRRRPVVDLQARQGRRADRRRRAGSADRTADAAGRGREQARIRRRSRAGGRRSRTGASATASSTTAAAKLIKPQHVVETLWKVTSGDAFVTSDVGQHQMWAAQYYRFDKPRRWINSGGLGTMGVGLPYAMGVQMANPGAQVACITGEASIQMCIQELSTCKQYRLTPKIVNLNNRYLGMVRQWQQIDYGSRYSESYVDALPDFVKLAEAYGHVGMVIDKPADVEAGAARGLRQVQGPAGVHGLHHRPDRERLADGEGGQGPDRDAARLGGPVMRHIISVLLENEPGRCRASSACSRRAATTSRR